MTLRGSVSNRLVIFTFRMFFVMVRHLPDEYRREEHKDEGLEERHEQLKEADWNRGKNRDEGNRPGSKPALRAVVGSRAKSSKNGHQRVARHHVRKETNSEGNRLDEETEQFDGQHDWQQVERSAAREVLAPALEPK